MSPDQERHIGTAEDKQLIRVIAVNIWSFGETNTSEGGLVGQVTHCMYKNWIPFYVRESVRGIHSFFISSGERWGDKVGRKPRAARQVLELRAPGLWWQEIADAVREMDTLKRRVLPNRNFNRDFIRDIFGH